MRLDLSWGKADREPTFQEGVARLEALLPTWAEAYGRQLPRWASMVVCEERDGNRSTVWQDATFFHERFDEIRSETTRDWVNLQASGVENGVLQLVVEYLTSNIQHVAAEHRGHHVNLSGPSQSWWNSLPPRQ